MSDLVRFRQGDLLPFAGARPQGLTPHGSADWMSSEQAAQLGLYSNQPGSFIFARGTKGVMAYGRGKHALVCAPSRSGKGVSFVVPNLLTWEGSAFAIDPKGELAHLTSDYRSRLGPVYVLDPCRVSGRPASHFNPLDWLIESSDLDTDLRRIVAALTPDNGGTAAFWNHAARDLLVGLIMYQIAVPHEQVTLGRTYQLLHLPEQEWARLIKEMARCDGGSPSVNAKVREKARWFHSLHEEHQQYHRGTLQYHLAWLGVSAAREMVERSDFDVRELKTGRATVYVCIPAFDSETYEGFTRVLTTLAIQAVGMWLVPPGSKERPVLLMLDEFATTVGRMRVFDDAYTNITGFGGRFAIILQTIDQLQSLFPERKGNQSWKTVYQNAGLRLFFDAQGDTAKFVSDELGDTTVDQIAPIGGSKQAQRRLLFPNEVSFPRDEKGNHVPDAIFAFVEGWPPIRARRLSYYSDPEFRGKFNTASSIALPVRSGLSEYQAARQGYGAGVAGDANPLIATRYLPLEPPAVTEQQKADYIRLSGWGRF